jgi:hypothetical protein
MNAKIIIPCLILAFGGLGIGQRLTAQVIVNPHPPGSAVPGESIRLPGALTATTPTGQDVTGGFRVVVGQPIPTVTFGLGGPGVTPPESWVIFTAAGQLTETPVYGIAPGLSLLGAPGQVIHNGTFDTFFFDSSPAQLIGTPTQTGVFDITMWAGSEADIDASDHNGATSDIFDFYITVVAAPATTFTTQPGSQSVAVGQSVTFTAAAAGSPTYQWSFNGSAISGATGASLTLTNVSPSAAGSYTVTATVSGGSVTSNSATLAVLPLSAPTFTVNPVSVTIASGRSVAFSVAASGELAPTYQWNLNGAPITGATDPVLLVSGATSANAGSYTCTASNASGAVTSAAATLTVTTTSTPGHLVNLSARADIGTGNNILIGGFATGGTGTKQILIRGAGPALSAFLGNNALANPQLTLLDPSGSIVSSNLGWGTAPTPGPSAGAYSPMAASLTLMNSTGAYPYQAGSLDTATLITAPVGSGTAQVSGASGATGIGLVEFYDADTTTPTARLINMSARADVGTGNNILIGGFTVGGSTAETLLIRAVGPGLNDELPNVFPLSSVLNQPVLTILDHTGTAISSNTVWGGDATEAAVSPTVGAFSLNPAHQDSVLLLSLPPGNYTAQVSGLNSGTGIALCEIYEVP